MTTHKRPAPYQRGSIEVVEKRRRRTVQEWPEPLSCAPIVETGAPIVETGGGIALSCAPIVETGGGNF